MEIDGEVKVSVKQNLSRACTLHTKLLLFAKWVIFPSSAEKVSLKFPWLTSTVEASIAWGVNTDDMVKAEAATKKVKKNVYTNSC